MTRRIWRAYCALLYAVADGVGLLWMPAMLLLSAVIALWLQSTLGW